MKKGIAVGVALTLALALLSSCGSSSSYTSSGSSKSSNIGAGGYEMPNSSDKSFSDYVKRVAPDVYGDIVDRYDSLH